MSGATLITGSTGFVGKNLVKFLKDRNVKINEINRERVYYLNHEDLNNVENIIHLAGKAHDLKKTSKPDEYYLVNYELTKKIFDQFLKSDARKFIFISSVKAVADSVAETLIEEMMANPQTDYGKSKLMAEQYLISAILPEGKSVYILRPCMIHGPGNKGNLNLLYKFIKSGIPYPLASFSNKRSFLCIDNLCFIIMEILSQSIKSGIYNVADDDPLSTNEVVQILAETLNKKAKLLFIPQAFIKIAAKIGDFLNLPIGTERLNKLTENYVVSNFKIKEAIKKQLPTSTKDGLILTAKSFLK